MWYLVLLRTSHTKACMPMAECHHNPWWSFLSVTFNPIEMWFAKGYLILYFGHYFVSFCLFLFQKTEGTSESLLQIHCFWASRYSLPCSEGKLKIYQPFLCVSSMLFLWHPSIDELVFKIPVDYMTLRLQDIWNNVNYTSPLNTGLQFLMLRHQKFKNEKI